MAKRRVSAKQRAAARRNIKKAIAANRRRGRRPLRRGKSSTVAAVRRFVRKSRAHPKRRIVRVHRGQVALVNRRRRYHRRRSYRHNPISFGGLFSAPMLKTVAFTAGGFLGVPFVEGFVNTFVPTSIQGRVTSYAVKVASLIGLSWVVGRFVSKDAGQKVAVGGAAYIAIFAVKDFFPTLLPAAASGAGRYIGAQPLLGSYQRNFMGSPITATAPTRLMPSSRY